MRGVTLETQPMRKNKTSKALLLLQLLTSIKQGLNLQFSHLLDNHLLTRLSIPLGRSSNLIIPSTLQAGKRERDMKLCSQSSWSTFLLVRSCFWRLEWLASPLRVLIRNPSPTRSFLQLAARRSNYGACVAFLLVVLEVMAASRFRTARV